MPKVLGMGTDYAKGQSTCMMLDMRHPTLVGELEAATKLKTVDGTVVPFIVQGESNG